MHDTPEVVFMVMRRTLEIEIVVMLIALSYWRTRRGFLQHAFMTNTLLMVGGFMLVGYQLTGYFVAQ